MSTAADWLPSLSRGRHHDSAEGGCFMEVASWFAGEPWSDHPSCTHPLLAQVAREVNDQSTDEGRPALASLIPDVIGANPADPGVAPRLVLACTAHALPFATDALRRELEWARCRATRRLARVLEWREEPPRRLTAWWRLRSERDYLLDAICAVDHAVCALTRDRQRADERLRTLLAACIALVTGEVRRSEAKVLTEPPYRIQSSASSR